MHRGTTVEVDLAAAARNLASIKQAVGGRPVIAVVKADAYGHGLIEVSRTFTSNGAASLAVAFVSEAKELRENGIKIPILVLFDRTEIESFFDLGLTPVIHDLKTAGAFSREASKRGIEFGVHLKVDTGMGRMGLESHGDVEKIAALPRLKVEGLMSHMSEADLADRDFSRLQVERFQKVRQSLNSMGIYPTCHMANSAAALSMTDSLMDSVRPGIALYGCSPFPEQEKTALHLRPVMNVKSKVVALRRLGKGHFVSYGRTYVTQRETLAAVLAVGYADGYSRSLSNNAHVLLRGKRSSVIGRVCMDLTVIDATDVEDITENDEAVLMGRQGEEEISAWELAARASTIPYEVMTTFGNCCTKRTYMDADANND